MIIGYAEINDCKIGVVKNAYFEKRISEFRLAQDKFRTYISYLLLKELAKKHGFDLDSIEITRDKNGKPVAKNNEFCFNISHSGMIVVVAIDDENIGVDIEQKRPFNPRVAEKFFADKIDEISNAIDSDIEFTKQWTIYEAQLKFYGSVELLRLNSKPNTISTNLSDSNTNQYIMTIATKKNIAKNDVTFERMNKTGSGQ